MPTTARISAVIAAVLAVNCSGPEPRPLNIDTTRAVRAVVESPGALATRHEAQESLDRARAAFDQKRFDAMRDELADAANFLRLEARQAEGDAGEPLPRAAAELDSLAQRIAAGDPPSATLLNRVFVNANRAEARYHLLRAGDAIATGDNDRAGEELTMSVDHVERAAKDAGRSADVAVRIAIDDARSLAGEMMKGMGAVPDEAWRVTEELDRAIDWLGSPLVRKEPTTGRSTR